MSERPWYAFYPADYERDTAHLTLLEHGAYRRLMDHYYSTGNMIPTRLEQAYRLTRAFDATEQLAVKSVLEQFFEKTDSGFRHNRIEQELDRARILSERGTKAGRASATRRQQDRNKTPTKVQPSQSQSLSQESKQQRDADVEEFNELHRLLAFDGNDHKNWLAFIGMKTTNGLDYAKHILPAARYHAESGKTGNGLSYIRPKAIELRDRGELVAAAPVIFEDTHPEGWLERLKFWTNHPEFEAKGHRWSPKWGPIWSDPGTKVPPDILANFKAKLNGNGHATA